MSSHRTRNFAKNQDMSAFQRSFLDELRSRTVPRSAAIGGAATWNYSGEGWRRVFLISQIEANPSVRRVYVIDDSADYRDRAIVLSGPFASEALTPGLAAMHPGHPEDRAFNRFGVGNWEVYYTGAGQPAPSTPGALAYGRIFANNLYLLLYARNTDGALCMARLPGDPGNARMSMLMMVEVTPKLGARTLYTPPEFPGFDGNDGSAIKAHDLNNLQDPWHMSQTPSSPGTVPLGPICREGNLPLEWVVRGKATRQPLRSPSMRRVVLMRVPGNTSTLLDNRQDWRDRMIAAHGCFSIADIRPGQGAQNHCGSAAGSSNNFGVSFYTGPGQLNATLEDYRRELGGSPVSIWAHRDTGHLHATNPAETDHSIAMLVCATPQLGPRSQKTVTTVLDTPPARPVPTGILVDDLSASNPGLIARYRFDRGMTVVDGRIAAVADQSGNGFHLVQHDHDRRPLRAEPVDEMRGRMGVNFDGDKFMEMVKRLPDSEGGYAVHIVARTGAGVVAANAAVLDLSSSERAIQHPPGQEDGTASFVMNLSGGNLMGTLIHDPSSGSPSSASSTIALGADTNVSIALNVELDAGSRRVRVGRRSGGTTITGSLSGPTTPPTTKVKGSRYRVLRNFPGRVLELTIWSLQHPSVPSIVGSPYITSRYGV